MKKIIFVSIAAFLSLAVQAKENTNSKRTAPPVTPIVFAGCTPSTAKTSMDVNNVRTLIFINGDMWWDLVGTATYEIPKGSGKHSLFAGALWMGGLDQAGNLRVAAQTYRQSGSDFWPGPVDVTNTSVVQDVCTKYDRHFKITREEVSTFLSENGTPGYVMPDVIKDWPGNGDPTFNQTHFLAPYYDSNLDNIYDPNDGDFPEYYFAKLPDGSTPGIDPCDKNILLGDQTLWWVFNDVGNTHQEETNSQGPIGLEIQAQAFGFATNDEINNMTFYRYKIINRNTTKDLKNCFFGAWVDPDVGNYLDDYVGCDVKRGFGYCYNGDENDEGAAGYGINPPAVGVDFFQGPLADVGDGLDNDRDGCVDCTLNPIANTNPIQYDTIPDTVLPEQIIMSKFVYYNNDFTVIGNPVSADDYYGYLRGIWKDGLRMTYGGDGHGGGKGTTTDTCDFMFPGTSDPTNQGTFGVPEVPWDEVTAGNLPADRRFLQSAGPFTLQPGAVNYITTGAVWARASNGGSLASVQLVRQADDFAQALFNNCFKIVDGPDAPDVAIREMDRELIFSLTNNNILRNNYKETYTEIDPNISFKSYYNFEGYQIYQLKDQTVSVTDLNNPDKARIVQQCDVKNGVSQIVNFNFDAQTGAWNGYQAVNGSDNGLRHSFRITTDLFASGNSTLVNHKTYYYMAVAYAYDADESPADPYNPPGRNKPYLAGRNNVKTYSAIPHLITPEQGGVVLNSAYGDGPEITRIEGKGNGYLPGSDRKALDFKSTDDINSIQFAELLSAPYVIKYPVYAQSRGPVDIKVYDPVKIIGGDFEIWETTRRDTDTISNTAFHDSIVWKDVTLGKIVYVDTIWKVKNLNTGLIDSSDKTFKNSYDQLFSRYGFSVNMSQSQRIGEPSVVSNGGGFIEASIVYQNPKRKWLGGITDIDVATPSPRDWIASGKTSTDYNYTNGLQDADQVWEKVLGGSWAPYKFTRVNNALSYPDAVGFTTGIANTYNNEADLASVDIVLTNDKSKWTKCVVIEEQATGSKAIGNAKMGYMRKSPSLDQNYNVTGIDSGYSYFPGYAVNLNTGERLNMAFGEDSYLTPANGFAGETGGDMKWNPTSTYSVLDASFNNVNVFGGKHVIYVFGHVDNRIALDQNRWMTSYDGAKLLHDRLNPVNVSLARSTWSTCMWVGYVTLNSGESLLSNDARVRIRVSNPYRRYLNDSTATLTNDTLPKYRFNTGSLAASKGNVAAAKQALDLINVVPNPYYANSSYEKNQLDHRVKIVNLPTKCSVRIYSPSGVLIRKLNRDVSGLNPSNGSEGASEGAIFPNLNLETALDWDLKNETGIPVSSGIYIIHVDAPGVGEKTIKLFAVQRPIDLDTF